MNTNSFALVGLGNPGNKYLKTRHNVGFRFVDWFAEKHGAQFSADRHQSLSARLNIDGLRLHLMKPQTFMNRSGRAVAGYTHYFDIEPANLLVVHDDIDMHPGRVKLVDGGGTGGHNGIRSIVKELGTNNFFRLKIGIGRPGTGMAHVEMPVENYVLADFTAEELQEIEQRFSDLDLGLGHFFRRDTSRAMTILNAIK